MSPIIHFIGSYPLLIGLFSQFIVLAGAWKGREKSAIIQAVMLIAALGLTSLAITLRPPSPPKLIPDLLGCVAAAFLLTPAVVAVRKMLAKSPPEQGEATGAGKSGSAPA